jgi:hypothetical protein
MRSNEFSWGIDIERASEIGEFGPELKREFIQVRLATCFK